MKMVAVWFMWMSCAVYTAITPFNALAQQGRVRDLSMTQQEMIQQKVPANQAGVPLGGSNLSPSIPGNSNFSRGTPAITGTTDAHPSKNYMDGYCDPNFKPLMAQSAQHASMVSCLERQKTEACSLYQSAPDDARAAIDASVNCAARAMNAMGDDGGESDEEDSGWGSWGGRATTAPVSCVKYDAQRLTVLKRYWDDNNTAYALVFLPDLVMDASGSCVNTRQRGM